LALNKAVFQTRALTALIFVIVMLTGLLWNYEVFFLLFAIVAAGAWFEYIKICSIINRVELKPVYRFSLNLLGLLLALTGALGFFPGNVQIAGFENLSRILVFVWLGIPLSAYILLSRQKDLSMFNKMLMLAGFAYLSIPFALLFHLRLFDIPMRDTGVMTGKLIVCGMIFSIWINDTMAYLVGSFIGKTPLSKISPKKTWEGTVGGIILCIVSISIAGYFIPVAKIISWKHWMAIAAIAAIFGTFGDLLESKLKRSAGIKDSGNFMPGHGGFLDRFDSLILATPFVWMYVNMMI
jgi:phosphatidate cytidylyltransferase